MAARTLSTQYSEDNIVFGHELLDGIGTEMDLHEVGK